MTANDPTVDAPHRLEVDAASTDELTALAQQAHLALPRLQAMPMLELMQLARSEGVDAPPNLTRQELVFELLRHRLEAAGLGWAQGILEVMPDGFGFLRAAGHDYRPGSDDVYVSPSQIRRLNLKPGHEVAGPVRPPRRGEKYLALLHVELVNGGSVAELWQRVPFESLTPILPQQRLRLRHPGAGPGALALDLLAPWGRGQRVLIAAPPQSGRTLLLTDIARALLHNHADLHVILCLVDERPEDVTEVRRQTGPDDRRDVVASTFDEPARRHIELVEASLHRAQRMVEAGRHVVLVLDSLTRLVRAYHQELPPSGKLLAAGLDASALQKPRQVFGAARNTEEAGSLTVIATVLTATGSRVDEVIAEEFVGRANSDVVLDRALAERRVFPAIDVGRTGTRREDRLLSAAEARELAVLRDELLSMPSAEAVARLRERAAARPDAG